jgi:hypothetical protein
MKVLADEKRGKPLYRALSPSFFGMLTAFQNSMDSFDMETEVREVDFI